jgi:hypothetical protein
VQGHISNRIAAYRYIVLPAALFAPVAALAETACSTDSTSLDCRLREFLHWLQAAAFGLVILLIIVIAVVVHLFRKNRLSRKEGR